MKKVFLTMATLIGTQVAQADLICGVNAQSKSEPDTYDRYVFHKEIASDTDSALRIILPDGTALDPKNGIDQNTSDLVEQGGAVMVSFGMNQGRLTAFVAKIHKTKTEFSYQNKVIAASPSNEILVMANGFSLICNKK